MLPGGGRSCRSTCYAATVSRDSVFVHVLRVEAMTLQRGVVIIQILVFNGVLYIGLALQQA